MSNIKQFDGLNQAVKKTKHENQNEDEVGKTTIHHSFGNGLYNLCMVIGRRFAVVVLPT